MKQQKSTLLEINSTNVRHYAILTVKYMGGGNALHSGLGNIYVKFLRKLNTNLKCIKECITKNKKILPINI